MDIQIGQLQKGQPTPHDRLTKQAQKWASQTFYETMLKQMGNSPFKSELFSGGRGGQMFNEMFDQRLADHMSRGAGNKLVGSMVKRLEARAAYAKQNPLEQSKQAPKPQPSPNTNEFKNVRIHVAPGLGT